MQQQKHCDEHGKISFQVERLTMRMDRMELGIVACLFMLVAALWQLWDLPSRIQSDRRSDKIISDANAESR